MSTFRVSEYPNDLTVKLLAQGCTPDNHPENARWESGWGQFEYTKEFLRNRVYETPCGLFWREESWCGRNMGYGGIEWCHENDNPVVRCPYIPTHHDCALRDSRLRSSPFAACAVRPVDKPYDYAHSVAATSSAQQDEDAARSKKALKAFAEHIRAETGGFCPDHARWNGDRCEWTYLSEFDPNVCVETCDYQPCLRCGIRDDGKEGNVLYDIRESFLRSDGSLFDGEWNETVLKGARLFNHPRRLAVCEMTVRSADYIMNCVRGKSEYRRNLYFEEHHWHGRYMLSVENIRIVPKGAKDVRDLIADLQAARDGVSVIHASDLKKATDAAKKERREKNKARKASRMEQLILNGHYAELEDFKKNRIEKTLGSDRLEELLKAAKHMEPKNETEQISLFSLE